MKNEMRRNEGMAIMKMKIIMKMKLIIIMTKKTGIESNHQRAAISQQRRISDIRRDNVAAK